MQFFTGKHSFFKAFLVCTALILPGSSILRAQSVQAGLGVLVGVPQGEFRENVDNLGYGIGGHIGYIPTGSPFILGAEFGFMNYGTENQRVPFSETVPRVAVDVRTTNNILLGHLLVRLQPQTGILRPYIDGLLGFNYFATTSSVRDITTSEDLASSNNQADAAFSYGAGAGLMFRVYERAENASTDTISIAETLIDLRVRYLAGGNAEYLKKGSIREDQTGKIQYDVLQSRTDMITVQLGVAVKF